MLEISRLIAEVKDKDDVRILPGDPAFALVTLNQLTLEDMANRLTGSIRAGIAEFGETVQKTEARAGAVLAEHVKSATADLRRVAQQDLEDVQLDAAEIIRRIDRCHRSNLLCWCAFLVFSSFIAFFAVGVWVGASYFK